MNKQLLIRHLWRSLQRQPKMDNMRSFKNAPRKEPYLDILAEGLFRAAPAGVCLATVYYYWNKQKDMKFLEEQMRREPIPLPDNLKCLTNKEMKYRPMTVIGEFDHTMEKYLRPRKRVTKWNEDNLHRNRSKKEKGIHVVTPFTLKDTGERILINRGWIPEDKKDPRLRLEGQIEGEVELVGAVQHSERAILTRNNAAPGEPDVYYTRDVDSLAKSTHSLPVYLDAFFDSTVAGGPIGGQIDTQYRRNMSTYAVLFLTAHAICYSLWRRKFPRR